jgi:hypothetical protein
MSSESSTWLGVVTCRPPTAFRVVPAGTPVLEGPGQLLDWAGGTETGGAGVWATGGGLAGADLVGEGLEEGVDGLGGAGEVSAGAGEPGAADEGEGVGTGLGVTDGLVEGLGDSDEDVDGAGVT